MNGKKYKVTINTVDHPPRYCDDWKEQQVMSGFAQSNIRKPPTENKPVYKSCVTLQLSDKRSKSGEIKFAKRATSGEVVDQESKITGSCCDSHVKGNWQEILGDRRRECSQDPLEFERCTSLNIYKLERNITIADPYGQSKEGSDQHRSSVLELHDDSGDLETLSGRFPKLKKPGLPYLNKYNVSTAKYGVGAQKNGFNVDQPVVILSSWCESEQSEEIIFPNMNGTEEGFNPSDCLVADSLRRPRLNREGSACSSDSIITEIEGLSDDDHECKELCEKADENETGTDESSQMTNNNWKKIRSMLHWSPFANNYKKKYPWVQLAGHQGNFKAGEPGTILKKTNNTEKECLIKLMNDVLRPYVPEFKSEIEKHDERYLVMQDLLSDFQSPSVMDCKMGVRTFLEDELEKDCQKPKLRKDLYQKMIDLDQNAPTEEEHEVEAITKSRYMKWREELSSSASLGFRIEGLKKSCEKPNKDFKTTRSREDLGKVFKEFINNDVNIKLKYLQRLKTIRDILESSNFFKIHEVIGSSLLFVHDCTGSVNIWMIDFAKTHRVEDCIQLNHRAKWQQGNHEDGYLFGLDNMISIWSNIESNCV